MLTPKKNHSSPPLSLKWIVRKLDLDQEEIKYDAETLGEQVLKEFIRVSAYFE